MSKIARRQFIQLSAVAAAGCFIRPGTEAQAQELVKISEDDPVAQSLKYTHDASSVDQEMPLGLSLVPGEYTLSVEVPPWRRDGREFGRGATLRAPVRIESAR